MVQQKTISHQDFDPIQFEIEREEIFNKSELSSQKYHHYSDDYSSGAWDASIGAEPQDYQLFSADYVTGYLDGTKGRLEKRLIELQQSAA